MNQTYTLPPRPGVPKELVERNGFLLARLGVGLKLRAIELAEQAGCEIYDYSVLAILAEAPRQAQTTIAGTLMLDPSRLVALLDSLEKRGFVTRQRDPDDRRRHTISITPEGKREHARLRAMFLRLEEEYFEPLSADDRRVLHDLLLRLAAKHDPGCAFAADAQASAEAAAALA
jgi:DNA-binding MarR family transcriptional regulator